MCGWVICCPCMSKLVLLDAIVPISIVRSLCLSNQRREFDDDGEIQPTNATDAELALRVDMLSQVSSENSAPVVSVCPSILGKDTRVHCFAQSSVLHRSA